MSPGPSGLRSAGSSAADRLRHRRLQGPGDPLVVRGEDGRLKARPALGSDRAGRRGRSPTSAIRWRTVRPAGLGRRRRQLLPRDHRPLASPPGLGERGRRALRLTSCTAFPAGMGKVLYSTDRVESVSARLRRVTRDRGHFPSGQAALKVLCPVVRELIEPKACDVDDVAARWKSACNASRCSSTTGSAPGEDPGLAQEHLLVRLNAFRRESAEWVSCVVSGARRV
ncbi:transposase [Streptomyces adustus]